MSTFTSIFAPITTPSRVPFLPSKHIDISLTVYLFRGMGSDITLYERMRLQSVTFYIADSLEVRNRPTGYTPNTEKDFTPLGYLPLNLCG
jgi:hypothetical protein